MFLCTHYLVTTRPPGDPGWGTASFGLAQIPQHPHGHPPSPSHSPGLPAFLVLLVLSIDSSVYGRRTVLFSGSQDSGSALQNVSL